MIGPAISPTAYIDELVRRISGLPPGQQKKLTDAVMAASPQQWVAWPGPQTEAALCQADELFYGGAAGCGKTVLLFGLSLTAHRRSLILRRTHKEASRMADGIEEIVETRDGWNSQAQTWRRPDGRVIELGGCQLEEDKQRYKGSPHDLIGFDEIVDFTESQYRFIGGWNRSASDNQRCRIVATGNPPTKPEGLWVIKYWAAWLDPRHPNPAAPGELRWYTTIDGRETEVDGRGPYDAGGLPIFARSRTFIPGRLTDNPGLAKTGYGAVLAALPEPLRSAYLEGRFDVSIKDDDNQLIPTAWVDAAMERWRPDGGDGTQMTAIGFDPAGGGEDAAVLAARRGGWIAPLVSVTGAETADGAASAGLIVRHRKDGCVVVIDMGGGYGGAVALRLRDNAIPFVAFNGAEGTSEHSRDGAHLAFQNKRALAYWRVREALSPDGERPDFIALPPDNELKADLTAQRWSLGKSGIVLEPKDDIRARIGRSPGKGDAIAMCMSAGETAAARHAARLSRGSEPQFALAGHSSIKRLYGRA